MNKVNDTNSAQTNFLCKNSNKQFNRPQPPLLNPLQHDIGKLKFIF